jgi:hypothetical protein
MDSASVEMNNTAAWNRYLAGNTSAVSATATDSYYLPVHLALNKSLHEL